MSLEDDTTFRKANGVPSHSDEFIQRFLQGRDSLVYEEKKQRSDRVFRQSLSPASAEACAIVDQIRFEEQQTIWTREYENSLAEEDQDIYPGMMFSLAKERMEKSKLWKIIKKMPKGALLHCHIEAMVDFDWAMVEAFNTKNFCIKAKEPLSSPRSRRAANFEFVYKIDSKVPGESIWSDTYTPSTPVPLTAAADAYPDNGKAGFIEWVRSRVTITHEESLRHHYGPNDVWRKFLSCFPILGSIIYYEPIFKKFLQRMFTQLAEDGVQWVELRSAFYTPFYSECQETPDQDHEGFFDCLEQCIEAFQKDPASRDRVEFWGARVIWTTIRALDTPAIIAGMKECISLKMLFPDLIAGYDLVGQEDAGRPLSDLVPELFWFRKACAQSGVTIPFFFHAGETLGDGDSTDENLFDAILLGTRRIGHGFSLYKHPLLIDMIKDKRILVESCPVSNEVLRLCSSIMAHSLPALLARGVPCALSNDDPTILGHGEVGQTHDFWQAIQGWENLGLAGLGSLAENSVRWAAFEDEQPAEWTQGVRDGVTGKGKKGEYLKQWMKSWERFCVDVVQEYSPDEDLDPDE
ncbi:Metallo-dependent hydrolase [Pseudovirgaria hyperparasitica]|uniref:adenosine deaminase n=1 Tax=Pseudovirgaria hyperparasitica TaxID=470096 RepID=A0A6A6W731_9PEZI|nr:Metallo-dependent hydrolase [Pseudovirgaria hyperparasitica]KAF2758662.1 Metallo-dependent hydrolase [Pseudovirgaria hyperparasitica]